MDNLLTILLFIFGLAFFFVAYSLVPWIVASLAKLKKSTIDLIVLANAVVVLILLQLFNPNLTTNLLMGIITLFLSRKRLLSKGLKPNSNIDCSSNTPLTMNPQMGKKWFIFYARVRPWFAFISLISWLISIIRYPMTFASSASLIVAFLASIMQACLAYRVLIWSRRDYRSFVSVVEDVLFFEIIITSYQVAVSQYYQNGYDLNTALAVGIVILVLLYLLWYRLNIKYFHKRLFSSHDTVTITPMQEKHCICPCG